MQHIREYICDKCGKRQTNKTIWYQSGYHNEKHWFSEEKTMRDWVYIKHTEFYGNGRVARLLCPDCYKEYVDHVNKFYDKRNISSTKDKDKDKEGDSH